MAIDNWQHDMAQLMFNFKAEPNKTRKPVAAASSSSPCFEDQFGNCVDFSHTHYFCFAPRLLHLLRNPALQTVEIDDVDKGFLSYSVYNQGEYYVLFETRVNLYGRCGHFTSFVVIPTLDHAIEFVEEMAKNKEA
jgi:hypothetical protein